MKLAWIAAAAASLAFGAHAETCPEYVGKIVKLQPYSEVRSKLPKLTEKAEFETTEQFKARLGKSAPSEIFTIAKTGNAEAKYDADKGGFNFTREALGVVGLGGFETIGEFNPLEAVVKQDGYVEGLIPLIMDGQIIVLSDLLSPSGTYPGANAFGAKTTVRAYNEQVSAILNAGADNSSVRVAFAPVNINEAKTLKANLKIAYVFQYSNPFLVRGEERSAATIDDPRDVTTRFEIITGSVKCGLLVSGIDSRVIGSVSIVE